MRVSHKMNWKHLQNILKLIYKECKIISYDIKEEER